MCLWCCIYKLGLECDSKNRGKSLYRLVFVCVCTHELIRFLFFVFFCMRIWKPRVLMIGFVEIFAIVLESKGWEVARSNRIYVSLNVSHAPRFSMMVVVHRFVRPSRANKSYNLYHCLVRRFSTSNNIEVYLYASYAAIRFRCP